MTAHRIPPILKKAPRRSWLLLGAICAVTAGCNRAEPWDAEFDCRGQEQSIATFTGDPSGKAARKHYPLNIDFHLRANTGMVRSSLVKVIDNGGDLLRFEAKGVSVWVSGQFDRRSQALSLVEERLLEIEGRQQQVRLTGQYVCSPTGQGAA
jgi:hypothetical protein